MKQYKKKTYPKTVKKIVHPRRRSGPKSTAPADGQKRGKQFKFVADEVLIEAYPISSTEANPLEKYAMEHGVEVETGLRVTRVNFTIVPQRDTSKPCTPPKGRIVFHHCHFYCTENSHMYLPRDTVFEGCTFHHCVTLHVGRTCEVIQSHANCTLHFDGGCSDISIMDSTVDGMMFFHHCSMVSMENVCHTRIHTRRAIGRADYMFGPANRSIFIVSHDGNVELNNCRMGAIVVTSSSIASMTLVDTDFGHMDIDDSIVDALTVQGCGKNGHAGVIKAYRSKLTTAPDFAGSASPVHVFPTRCEGKWEEAQDSLTLYKKVWYIPGILAKLPFCGHLISPGVSRRIPVLARLRVPAGTPRHLDTGTGKVRVAEATVDGFFTMDRKTHALVEFKSKLGSFVSDHDHSFRYANGKRVRPRREFDLTDDTCASGIHGFLTPEEADSY